MILKLPVQLFLNADMDLKLYAHGHLVSFRLTTMHTRNTTLQFFMKKWHHTHLSSVCYIMLTLIRLFQD